MMMKIRIYIIVVLLGVVLSMSGQAKMPKLMVVPSDVWCSTNACMDTMNVMGDEGFSDRVALKMEELELEGLNFIPKEVGKTFSS